MATPTFIVCSSATAGFETLPGASLANVTIDATLAHTGVCSYKLNTGSPAALAYIARSNIVTDAGSRISAWFRFPNPTPAANTRCITQGLACGLQPNGKLYVTGGGSTVSGTTLLSANTWYRISLSYKITSATVWTVNVYLNGNLECTLSNGGSVTTGNNTVYWLADAAAGANWVCNFDELYVDNGADLSDPGGGGTLGVTAKLPLAANQSGPHTYLIGNGAVNERPINTANGIQVTLADHRTYTLEAANVGDANVQGTQLGYVGWGWISSGYTSVNGYLYVNGSPYAITVTNAIQLFQVMAAGAYVATGDAIGVIAPSASGDIKLYECGLMVAYSQPAQTHGTATFRMTARGTQPSPTIKFISCASATMDLVPWSASGGAVSIDSTVKRGTNLASWKANTSSPATTAYLNSPVGIVSDAGARISAWVYFPSIPTIGATFLYARPTANFGGFGITLTPAGKLGLLGLTSAGGGVGPVYGNTTIQPNTWYRISFAYTITSATVWSANLYINGNLEVSNSNNGSIATGTSIVQIYVNSAVGANVIVNVDELVVDAGNDLADPGQGGSLGVTAKLPTTVNSNTWNSTSGTGAINERPTVNTNNIINTAASSLIQAYNVQAVNVGDVDISPWPLLGYMGWATIYFNGTHGAEALVISGNIYPITGAAAWTYYFAATAGIYVNTGNAIGARSAASPSTYLGDCGLTVAYITWLGHVNFSFSASATSQYTYAPPTIHMACASATEGFEPFSGHSTNVTIDTATVRGTNVASYKLTTSSPATLCYLQRTGVLSDTGSRVSIWFYFPALPPAAAGLLLWCTPSTSGGVGINLDNAGHIGVFGYSSSTGYVGLVYGTTVLQPNTWYRLALAYKITSATVWSVNAYINGKLEVSQSNAGTITTGTILCEVYLPTSLGANFVVYCDEWYLDTGSDLGDPGGPNAPGGAGMLGVTAKLPTTVNSNTWTTIIGTGAVNERPINTANAVENTTATSLIQGYNVQAANVGDWNISFANINTLAYLGWVYTQFTGTHGAEAIVANGTIFPVTFPAAWSYSSVIATGSYSNTGNAIGARSAASASTWLAECGLVVGYINTGTGHGLATFRMSAAGTTPKFDQGSGSATFTMTALARPPAVTNGSATFSLSAHATSQTVAVAHGTSVFMWSTSAHARWDMAGHGLSTFSLTANATARMDITGHGTSAFHFTATGTGETATTAHGLATFSQQATGQGRADITGHGTSQFSMTATAVGRKDVVAHGSASFSFSATGHLISGGLNTGSGHAQYTMTAHATSQAIAISHGIASYSFAANAQGKADRPTHGTAQFSMTTAGVGRADRTGHGLASFSTSATGHMRLDFTGHGAAIFSMTALGHGQVQLPTIGHGLATFMITASAAGLADKIGHGSSFFVFNSNGRSVIAIERPFWYTPARPDNIAPKTEARPDRAGTPADARPDMALVPTLHRPEDKGSLQSK
jgi:hypothetical protein